MSIFSKDSISNPDFEWFKSKLDPSFQIEDDGYSKVIFGFNGIGKSTIFKCIKQLNNLEVDYLEYGEIRDQIIKGKDKLLISQNINQIEQLKSQRIPLLNELNIKKSKK
jgi:ABC-type cobalamin/Fe3+-siderophores transport system ATPase subunit